MTVKLDGVVNLPAISIVTIRKRYKIFCACAILAITLVNRAKSVLM